ncbi:hypothetical protein DEO72_LG7g1104 [Vigna unguiculata]|uniref:Uncharacterized protein n=1 Tax=Vigna unguiculata TaxID=3917 RepID=A0A4D6MHW0_VIGUN|nr:hypothetical protein DEO72_LG7g1104 [Vigna unguiculata]
MNPATIDLDDYESSENQIVPDSGDFRLERRWKRRELSNIREKHNHHDSGTRSTINNCGNVSFLSIQEGPMSEDEMDEDYKLFLVTYNYEDIDVVSGDNADDPDNDINIGYDSVHYDPQYMMFLGEERFHNDPKLDTGMMNGSKQRYETRKNGNKGSGSVRKPSSGPIKSQLNLGGKRRLSKKRPSEDVSDVPGNNFYTEMKGSKQSYETGNAAYKGSDSLQKQTSCSLKSCQNLEAKRGHSKKRPHEYVWGLPQNICHNEMMNGPKQTCESGNRGSDLVRKQTRVIMKSQQNLEAGRGLSKKRPYEDVSVVPENNCHSNTELDVVDEDYQIFLNSCIDDYVPSELIRKTSSVMGNSQVSDHEMNEGDEDYLQYLNSLSIFDDEVECMAERNNSKTDMPERNTTKPDMPEKNTSKIDMPKRNTTQTDMPKRNTTKTDMPEKNTLKTDMPQWNTTETDMPKWNTTETDMRKRNTSYTDMSKRNTTKADMPKRNTSKTNMPEKNSLKTNMPRRNTLETDMPKWNTIETDMPKRNTSETDMPKRNITKTNMPKKKTSKTDMPKRNTSQTDMPKWNAIETDMHVRKTLESGMLDWNTFKTDMPERNTLHTHMPERNISNSVNVDDDSNSSEPDVILLEPDQIHENSPFVSSKTYDLSWFGTEVNLKDNWQLSAYDHSQFRKRLMNDLQRPYDKEEHDRLLLEVNQKRKTERHIETRQGVVKSYCTKGVNKSYLELYPEIAKAMTKFRKPEMVLFILRGFIFWLQNLTHQGIFKPWDDNLCLEILSKM